MSLPEFIGAVLQKSLNESNPQLRRKLLQQQIFSRWHEIFKTLADKLSPVEIQGDTLFVTSADSSIRDLLKFAANNFVNLINDKISPELPIISHIQFSRTFAPPPFAKLPAKVTAVKKSVALTPSEIESCKNQVAAITDETQRAIFFQTLLSLAKSQKRKLQSGWLKCQLCNSLCPPNDSICPVCKVKERGRMSAEIRKIFCNAPETPFREIQQEIIRQFPYLQNECTLENIESARMDLILQRAAKISYGDTKSDAVIFLVRLIRQLPREKLTEKIIADTLKEFKFNLADLPPLPKYEFSKIEKRTIKKIPPPKK